MNNDQKFLQRAIELAEESFKSGAFPAGALIVKNGEVISEAISSAWPNIHLHAESKAIDEAMKKLDSQLSDCVMYGSMESCLMCLSRAYWSGIRKIVIALKKERVNMNLAYESHLNQVEIADSFNQKMEIIVLTEFESQPLSLVKEWESKNI